MTQQRPSRRFRRSAVENATVKIARAAMNPVEVAAENERLRTQFRGAHALIHVLTRRLAGFDSDVTVPRADWMAIPTNEHLDFETKPDGDVILKVRRDK